ncbi:MAG TPA: STAS domain-containing protein [Methylomirabilota bacterium]|jgi:ABC-type transporter Mla MlaB component|nr:STAS domain-containing protein [Methylomirabilota bacterium]
MPPRLRIRRRQRDGQHLLRFEGEVDGSTACHALDVLARTPPDGRELVLDLSALTGVEAFGLEILSRGLRQLARQRRVRIIGAPHVVSVLHSLAASLQADRAA